MIPQCSFDLHSFNNEHNRGRDGWMASPTRWTWVWVNSGSWWWTGRPGVLQSMGSQSRTRRNDGTELNNEQSWASFRVYLGHLYVFFRGMSVQISAQFLIGLFVSLTMPICFAFSIPWWRLFGRICPKICPLLPWMLDKAYVWFVQYIGLCFIHQRVRCLRLPRSKCCLPVGDVPWLRIHSMGK